MGTMTEVRMTQKSGMKRRCATVFTALFLTALMAGPLFLPQQAFALKLTLKRAIFEGSKRNEVMTIINNSDEEQSYRLSWRHYRMTPDKGLAFIPEGVDPGDLKLADDLVRFAPRRVVLAPGASQQIRLMLRKPADLPEGEYRSHLWIQREAPTDSFVPDSQKTAGKGAGVKLTMLTGVTLPVFVRHGTLSATGAIKDPAFTRTTEGLKAAFTIVREGKASLYGDLDLMCSGAGGETVAKEVRGIALYPEISERRFEYMIDLPEGGLLACNSMKIVFREPAESAAMKGSVLSEATAALQ